MLEENYEKSIFIKSYQKQSLEILQKLYPNISKKKLLNIINKKINDNNLLKERNVILSNNYTDVEETSSLLKTIDFYYKKKPIMSGYGNMFKQHDNSLNLNGEFLKFLMTERKKFKKIQFEGLNEQDASKEQFGEMMQKTMKLLSNSYYGATGQESSYFYNPAISPSVTYTGYAIITTSIAGFERFLANNIKFKSFNDLCEFINNVINDTNSSENKIIDFIDRKIKKKEAFGHLVETCSFELNNEQKKLITNLINSLNQELIARLYFINNIYEFFNNSETIRDSLYVLLNDTIINSNKISDELKEHADYVWALLEEFVYYDYQLFNREPIIENLIRKVVLGSDTDSNFIGLQDFFDWVNDSGLIENPNENTIFTIANTEILFLSKFIQKVLDKYTGQSNVSEEKQPIINMKSEFLFKRMVFTRNKKQYLSSILQQEGNILIPPKVDIKGLSIRKATVNKTTQKFFLNLIKENILDTDKINPSVVLGKIKEYEETIRTSLESGETNYLKPDKLNDPKSYKLPYQMQVVRGTFLWNKLFPNNPIQAPDKVNLLKIKGETIEDLKPIYNTKEFKIINDYIFNSKLENGEENPLTKYGMIVIALPKSVEKIPEWLIPIIDYDTIIFDNVRNGNVLLESLGLYLMNYNNKEMYSNFIQF